MRKINRAELGGEAGPVSVAMQEEASPAFMKLRAQLLAMDGVVGVGRVGGHRLSVFVRGGRVRIPDQLDGFDLAPQIIGPIRFQHL